MPSIKEIEKRLFHEPCLLSDKEIQELKNDQRKGVRELFLRWQKQKQFEQEVEAEYYKRCTYERELYSQGFERIAGVDEAGRGPLAGPVVAGAVILPKDSFLPGLNDSKMLSKTKCERLYQKIMATAEAVGVGVVSVEEIDRINIYQASKKAMEKAIDHLDPMPDALLVDAMELPSAISQHSLVKGDSRSVSIAAGAIIAKVTRDQMMIDIDEKYPTYGFSRHFGYGTAEHLQNLKRHGACDQHRRSFAPVRDIVM